MQGVYSPELDQHLAQVEAYLKESTPVEVLQETIDLQWVQRASAGGTVNDVVPTLVGALMSYREGSEYRYLSCSHPIMMVHDSPNREQALEVVLNDFCEFVREREAAGGWS
jgi:hypothetical protein